MTKINLYSPYLIFVLALGAIFLFIGLLPIYRVGDGSEYYALFYAWSDTLRPWMTGSAYVAYEAFSQNQNIIGVVPADLLSRAFPALNVAETSDFNHFWFYSLLSYLASVPLKAFGIDLDAHNSFLLLHYLLLVTLISVFYYLYKWKGVVAAVILVFTSPLIWYLNKVHTELFTVVLTLMAVALIQKKQYLWGAFLLGLVSTQNISFALVAFIPFFYRVAIFWRAKFSITEMLLALGTAIIVLAHPAYYFFRYDVPTPQLLAGGASFGNNFGDFYIWLLDPNVGLLPYWPFGLIIIALSFLCFMSHRRMALRQEDYFFVFFIIFFLFINFYAQSSTENLNSGATRGPARYALWYLPLFLPLLLLIFRAITHRKIAVFVFVLTAGILGIVNYYLHNPAKGEQFHTPSFLSVFIQKNLSFIYSPPAEIFAERYSGVGEAVHGFKPRAILGPDCKKLLIYTGSERETVITPSYCYIDSTLLTEFANNIVVNKRSELESFYYILTKEEHSKSRLSLTPGGYTVGAKGNGNFILGSGWSVLENWGVWSTGVEVGLNLPCNSNQFYYNHKKIFLSLFFSPFGEQDITIEHMERSLYEGKITAGKQVQLELSPYYCNSESIDIDVFISEPKSPMELGQSSDVRKLGVALTRFELR